MKILDKRIAKILYFLLCNNLSYHQSPYPNKYFEIKRSLSIYYKFGGWINMQQEPIDYQYNYNLFIDLLAEIIVKNHSKTKDKMGRKEIEKGDEGSVIHSG